MSTSYGTIEVVRGRLDSTRADELVGFWTGAGALDEQAARERLPEVVCVLRGASGELAGVSSVYPASVELIGDRPFWVYRNYLRAPQEAAMRAMAARSFAVLAAEFDPAVDGPVGICLLLDDAAAAQRNPSADWIFPISRYAGYLSDGRQVRIRYFDYARIGRAREMLDIPLTADHRHRVVPFREQDEVTGDAVVDFWMREGAMDEDEARRRVDEVLAVATNPDGGIAGVATVYLAPSAQLRMDMWHFRVFVGADQRSARAAWSLAVVARDYLRYRFVSGQDTRGAGLIYEVENEGLKQHLDMGHWHSMDFTFIGETERGSHVRVSYFPGAAVPGTPG